MLHELQTGPDASINIRMALCEDLARIYGVTPKRFNEAVKRNARRFPKDFNAHAKSGQASKS